MVEQSGVAVVDIAESRDLLERVDLSSSLDESSCILDEDRDSFSFPAVCPSHCFLRGIDDVTEDDMEDRCESPLPGVDDEVPDSPVPGVTVEPASEVIGDHAPAASAEPSEAVRVEETAEVDITTLGKRREDETDSPALEAAGKRSRTGDTSSEPPSYEGLVFTAPDGSKFTAARKVATPKVSRV